jgi:uncharacterized membrane protein YbaN (DUF454 family)
MEYTDEIRIIKNPLLRWILLAAGTIFVGIGILGMFLPLLPTTIFFILAAYCYARSSVTFYHWLHHNKFFGKYFRNYRQGKGMTLGSKIFSLLLLWVTILYSAFFAVSKIFVKILLIAIALGVSWHIIAVKTAKRLE